jgi:hypothetical protein
MAVEVSFLTVRGSAVMRRSRCAEAVPGIENCLACHGAERVDLRPESTLPHLPPLPPEHVRSDARRQSDRAVIS